MDWESHKKRSKIANERYCSVHTGPRPLSGNPFKNKMDAKRKEENAIACGLVKFFELLKGL